MHKKTYTILSLLKEGVVESGKLFLDLWESGYRARHSYYRRMHGESMFKTTEFNSDQEERRRTMKSYYECIRCLERDGLISKTKENKKRYITITKEGLRTLKEQQADRSKSMFVDYEKKKIQKNILVIFDIPERLRKKRGWFRAVLEELDFHLVQKSVWIGKSIIPRDLIDDLKEMKILQYIHFFEVEKMGSLETVNTNSKK